MKTTLEELELLLLSMTNQISKLEKSAMLTAKEKFSASSGCLTCRGRGWIVTWDTLDSMSGCYHESSVCPEKSCTAETRAASGLDPANNKYDNFHNGSRWIPEYTDDKIKFKIFVEDEIKKTKHKIYLEEAKWQVAVGKVVQVASAGRGPKDKRVPIGTTGLVKKLHTNNWGTTKAIIITKDGSQWWPTLAQIKVIDPNPDMEIWNKLDRNQREKTGYPIVITVKKKTGKAALVKTTTSKEIWIPFSQVPELSKASRKQTLSVSVPMWIAEKNGLVAIDKQ